MSKPARIPIVPMPSTASSPAASGALRALLTQIQARLNEFLATRTPVAIDLRGAPMTNAERDLLDDILGRGEVQAEISSLGNTRVRDTALACVWRITHCDAEGEVLAELVEIAEVPPLLRADPDAITETLNAFEQRRRALLEGAPTTPALEPFSARKLP